MQAWFASLGNTKNTCELTPELQYSPNVGANQSVHLRIAALAPVNNRIATRLLGTVDMTLGNRKHINMATNASTDTIIICDAEVDHGKSCPM